MAVIGTFGSFTAARLGIYGAQASLNVTGNNIANINTNGYTRQRADLVSLHSAGSARIASGFNLDIGYGVLVDQVSQLRDPYLDILYRDEQASVGFYEARMKGLQQLSNILDEVGRGNQDFGVIEAQFNDFLSQLQGYNNRVSDDVFDTTVRGSAESLVDLFNTYAKTLVRVKDNQMADLQGDVKTVNTILTQIRDLNAQIRQAGLHHEQALELRDKRNVLIDKLSSYMKIEVQYSMEPVDEFTSVEKLSITLAGSGTPPTYLINGIYGTQLSMPEMAAARNPDYDPENPKGMQYISRESDTGSTPPKIVLTDNEREAMQDANGALMLNNLATREQLEGVGNVDPDSVYDPAFEGGMKYLDANGDPTDDPDQAAMVDNAKAGSDSNRLWMQLAPLVDERGRYIRDEYGKEITETVDLGDNDLYGSLQAKRELLTEEGEFASKDDIKFDPNANIKRGIPYYQRALDALARKFADSFNKANTVEGTDANGNPILEKAFLGYETKISAKGNEVYDLYDDPNDPDHPICSLTERPPTDADVKAVYDALMASGLSADEAQEYLVRTDLRDLPPELQSAVKKVQETHLTERGHGKEKYGGGILFSTSGDSNDYENITAANISIAKDWAVGSTRLLPSKNYNPFENTTADDNIYHMIGMMGEQMEYKADDISDLVPDADEGNRTYFKGTFQQRLADINNILATDQQTTTTQYTSFELTSLSLDNQRQSVSGVDLNEEATSMMMFQKSYAAACQLMTTLDSMLDKLINGTI